MVLRSPTLDEYRLLRPGACLIAVLHFPTRPQRVQLLKELGVKAVGSTPVNRGGGY
jgi:alanine dehydrogenase